MATVLIAGRREKIPNLRHKSSGWYYAATPEMQAVGIHSEALGKDTVTAVLRARELNAEWQAIRKGPQTPTTAHGSLRWLVRQFEQSSWYRDDIGPRMREEYDRYIRVILASPLNNRAVASIKRGDVRTFHEGIRAMKGAGIANRAIKTLRRVLQWGVEIQAIETNPALDMNLKHGRGRRQEWTSDEVTLFVEKAIKLGKPGWAIAVRLGYDTSQRLSDVLKAQWSHMDGRYLYFEQDKTGERVEMPLYPETMKLLGETPRKSLFLVYGDTGRPIRQRAYFSRVFRFIRDAAGINDDLQFRDLRRTAATEALRGGGRAEPLTGHRPGSTQIRVYEVPDRAAAEQAQTARLRGRKANRKSET